MTHSHSGLYIIGNWKMHGDLDLVTAMASAVLLRADNGMAKIVLCPPTPFLAPLSQALGQSHVYMGAQDCHAQKQGAYTGDISAAMLREMGCTYVIIGHSERRQHHGETSAQVCAKAQAALDVGLIPIICVGETLKERESGQAEAVVKAQLRESVPEGRRGDFLLAYEPVWAIGSGRTPTSEDIHSMHAAIRSHVPTAKLLYGGSVKASNAREILGIDGVDGVLVGGASLKSDEFCGIIDAAQSA